MSIAFSTNISSLRRQKNISQKEAAEALGISQALLSHYEKGIRECNLDFVGKAAAFYEVSTDYLLGVTSEPTEASGLTDLSDQPSDSQMKIRTLMRSFLHLAGQTGLRDEAEQMFFTDYFTLSIKKYLSAISGENPELSRLCAFGEANLLNRVPDAEALSGMEDTPLFLKTLDEHALFLLNNELAGALR